MRMTAFLVAWLLAVTAAHAGAPADLGVFSLDVVALLEHGEELPGDAAHAVEHRHFTYLFATAESKAAFEAAPDRYAVRQGGACPRMGALSGVGRPDLWAVHDGSLYFCASEGCRRTFTGEPHLLLESDDPAPSGGDSVRGAELAASVVAWIGGAEAIRTARAVEIVQRRKVESGDRTYDHTVSTLLVLPDAVRTVTQWDERVWTRAFRADAGFFQEPDGAVRLMDADQRAEMRRRLDRRLLVMLHHWLAGEAEAVALGADEAISGDRLALRHGGVTLELVVDPASGEPLAARTGGWGGPRATVGQVEHRFTEWREAGGVRVPVAWESWFNGQRDASADKSSEGVEVVANPPVEPAFFVAPLD